MQKRKIGILTFSDGRKFAHDLQYKMNKGFQDKLVKVLEKTGEIECVPCEIIWTPALARMRWTTLCRRMAGNPAAGKLMMRATGTPSCLI